MHRLTRRTSPAFVISILALVFAMTGGAVAAVKVTGAQIANSSVTGKDVRNHSLTPTDFRGSVRGPQGPQGPQGPAGPTVTGKMQTVRATGVVGVGDIQHVTVACPAGHRAISGGWTIISGAALPFVDRQLRRRQLVGRC